MKRNRILTLAVLAPAANGQASIGVGDTAIDGSHSSSPCGMQGASTADVRWCAGLAVYRLKRPPAHSARSSLD